MALHPEFPRSPYAPLVPSQRWFPADETLRSTAYEKLLPPLVAKIREEVLNWRQSGYAGASATSVSLLRAWFDTEHLIENVISREVLTKHWTDWVDYWAVGSRSRRAPASTRCRATCRARSPRSAI